MKLLIILIPVFLFQSLFSQEKKEITFSKEEKIEFLKQSKKYVNVVTKNQNSKKYSMNVYNQNSELIFSKKNINKIVKFSKTIDKKNSLIYIEHHGIEETNGSKVDKIVSIDLDSGNEKWSIASNAGHYELSPNQRYLITNFQNVDGNHGPFEIIDMRDGTKILQERSLSAHRAEWYDSIRVAFVIQKYENVPNLYYAEYEKHNEDRTVLIHERQRLSIQ